MKTTTQNIYSTLNQPILIEYFAQLKNGQPNHTFQETTLNEAYDDFAKISEMLLSAIDSQIFDKIPFTKRKQIWSTVSVLQQQLNQAKEFSFQFNNPNSLTIANSVIQQTINLVDFVENSNLYARTLGLENYKDEVKKLSDTRNKYHKLLNELNNIETLSNAIQNIYKVVNAFRTDVESLKVEADNKVILIGDAKGEAEKVWGLLNETRDKIKREEQEIESKRLGINTFHENIEEYKKSINDLEKKAEYLISKKTEIDEIILNAERALQLNSAIGISAAFSSQYKTASDQAKLKIKGVTFNLWIIGAVVFLCVAIGITIWIATGHLSDEKNGISLLIARIVAVAISITGATFCARQYIKQRNLAEDYAYKAVLSKSIVAFTDEIRKKDADKVSEYLSKVLDEIHKDPLRQRDTKEEVSVGINPSEIIKSLIDKVGGKIR